MRTNGDDLTVALDRAVRDGEVPYQANRKAIQAIDIFRDEEDGRQELLVLLDGLDVFITDLEALGHVAEKTAKQGLAAIR